MNATTASTPTEPPVLLTVNEVARRLCASKSTVDRLIASGALGSVKMGHLRRVPVAAIERYVESNTK